MRRTCRICLPNVYEDCPVCGKPSVLDRRLDHYFHEDGSDNVDCWVAIVRGE